MSPSHVLTLRINDQCTIDAGHWQAHVDEDLEPYRLVSPPQATMYQQVLSYLTEATKDQKIPPKSHLHFGEVALATVIDRGILKPSKPDDGLSLTPKTHEMAFQLFLVSTTNKAGSIG